MAESPGDGELREQINHMFTSAWQDGVHHKNPRYLRRDTLFTDETIKLIKAYATAQYQEGYKKGYVDAGIAAMTGQGDAA